MSKRYIKVFLLIGLMLTCLCCIFQCINSGFFSRENPTARAPLRILTIETDVNNRAELGEYLDDFSRKHSLKIDTAFYTNKKYDGPFMYIAYDEDFHIAAVFKPNSRVTDVSFFENVKGVSPQQERLNEIYDELKTYISKFPDLVVLEEK